MSDTVENIYTRRIAELKCQRDALAEALRICRGFVDAYGQPETKERLDALLARLDAEKEPTDAR